MDFSKLLVSGVSKLRSIGKSKGLILHKNLFKEFDAKVGDSLMVYYDEKNKCVIIKKGGM